MLRQVELGNASIEQSQVRVPSSRLDILADEEFDVEIGFPPARELDFQFFEGSKKTLQNTSC